MKKKIILMCLFIVFIMIPLFAVNTGKLVGRVIDRNRNPVAYANIILKGTAYDAITDEKGKFLISDITPGTYTIVCQLMGYADLEMVDVKIKANETRVVKILLPMRHGYEGGTITVSGKEGLVQKDRTGSWKSVYPDQMSEISVNDVDGVIAMQSGVTQKDEQLFVRGGRANEVNSMIDDMSDSDQNVVTREKIITEKVYIYGENHCPPYYYKRYYYPPSYNTEEYKAINPYPFKYAIAEPLSTFSIDVDTATYSNVRRLLNNNQLPDAAYVRIEEMINYFTYNYPEPEGNAPISISQELGKCPWNTDHEILKVGLKGKSVSYEEAPPANLVFLLDVSGSMNDPNKLPLVKQSMKILVNQMRPQDQIGIVTYASQASIKLESTPVSKRQVILDAIDDLYAGGSTSGGDGIEMAYEVAAENFKKHKNNRIILCTDGDFNVGAQSDSDMEMLITKKREEGVFLSVLGFGMGNIKDNKMEILADKGNGNYYYIDDLVEAKRVLVTEMSGTLTTIAKDVKIQLEFNPAKVRAYRLIGYENRALKNEDFKNDKIDAGEMGAGQTVTVLYEIVKNNSDEKDSNEDELKYQKIEFSKEALNSNELVIMKFRYKEPNDKVSKELTKVVTDIYPENNSSDFNFACSVAGFGMMLQRSKFRETLTWDGVIKMAEKHIGKDTDGYRKEFISLVEKADELDMRRKRPEE